MNPEPFDVIDRAGQSDDFHLATVARTGIHFANVQRPTKHPLNPVLDLPAEFLECGRCRSTGGESVPGWLFPAVNLDQAPLRTVRVERITRSGPQLGAAPGGQLAMVRNPDGAVHLGAQTAKDAPSKVQRRRALAVVVFNRNGAGGTDRGGGARVAP